MMSNKDKVIAKYGEYTFRMYEIFLGWSVLIAKEGSSTAYQIVCHKNKNNFERTRFIGGISLGEGKNFKQSKASTNGGSKAKAKPVKKKAKARA